MKALSFLLSFSLLASCSQKGIISMNVLEPSQVWVRPTVKKLGIINRSLPTPQTKPMDNLEKLLTLEGVNLDKEGAETSVSALRTELAASDRFPELVVIEEKELKTLGAGV